MIEAIQFVVSESVSCVTKFPLGLSLEVLHIYISSSLSTSQLYSHNIDQRCAELYLSSTW